MRMSSAQRLLPLSLTFRLATVAVAVARCLLPTPFALSSLRSRRIEGSPMTVAGRGL
jgi:hypothetical protein